MRRLNTIILLIDFEGYPELEEQNYLKRRYIALQNIICDNRIKLEDCIIVFNHYNTKKNITLKEKFIKENKELNAEFVWISNPTLRAIAKKAWVHKWNIYNLNTETKGGNKDIDIETFITAMNKKAPEFVIDGNTKIIIGGTEGAGCCLNNKKLGALHWVERGYDTTLYLPMLSDYTTQGVTWYDKQENAFSQFWKTVTSSTLRPDYYNRLNVENDYRAISLKLPLK